MDPVIAVPAPEIYAETLCGVALAHEVRSPRESDSASLVAPALQAYVIEDDTPVKVRVSSAGRGGPVSEAWRRLGGWESAHAVIAAGVLRLYVGHLLPYRSSLTLRTRQLIEVPLNERVTIRRKAAPRHLRRTVYDVEPCEIIITIDGEKAGAGGRTGGAHQTVIKIVPLQASKRGTFFPRAQLSILWEERLRRNMKESAP